MGMLIAYLLGILTAINSEGHNEGRDRRVSNSHEGQSFPQGPLSVVCVPSTLTDREQTEKKKNRRRKAISFWVRIASLALLALYAVVTILIWCATKKDADAARSAAETATRQEAFLEVSQRPWVEISLADPPIDQQQSVPPTIPINPRQPLLQEVSYSFNIMLKVYGNTPALQSYTKMQPEFVSLPNQVNVGLQNIPIPANRSCAQDAKWEVGRHAYFPTGSYRDFSNRFIADTGDMKKLMARQDALFWIGCVRYEDGFQRRYQSNFCFYWSASETPWGWARCLTGNDLIEYPLEPHKH